MLRDPAETARRRTEPNHRQIIANHTGRARASRKEGGQQEREALTARVRLPKHGVVAGRKRKYKGGTGERGLPSGGEPPENGPAPGDLGPSPEPPSASIERQFERPQAVVGVGSKGPRDGELSAHRQGSARSEHGAEVPTMPAPAVVPLGRGVVGGDHPRGGEPTAVGRKPAGVCRRGPKDKQRIKHRRRGADMQRAAEHPYAIAVQRDDMPPRAPKGRKVGRVRKASRAFLLLSRPKVLGGEAVSIRPRSVVVRELVPSPLSTM